MQMIWGDIDEETIIYVWVFLLLLAACGSNDGSKEDSAKTKSNAEQTKSKKSKRPKAGKGSSKAFWKTKLALAFCVEDVTDIHWLRMKF